MQATSTRIRDHRWGTVQGQRLSGQAFAARQAQVAAIKAAIDQGGEPETISASGTLTTYKLRRGLVGGETAEAQVTRHAAGLTIRFWVYGADFTVKVRDLVLLPSNEKGFDLWLAADGKLFPHEGKYASAGRLILANIMAGK